MKCVYARVGVADGVQMPSADVALPPDKFGRVKSELRDGGTSRAIRLSVIGSLAVLAGVIVFGFWYKPGEIILFWDQTFPLSPSVDIVTALHLWHVGEGFGQQNGTSFALVPYFCLVWLLEAALRSGSLAQAVLYYLVVASSLIGFYVFGRAFLCRSSGQVGDLRVDVVALIGALFYTFNPYSIFFEWRIVSSVIFLQALFPWWLLALTYWVEQRTNRGGGGYLVAFGLLTIGMAPGMSNPGLMPIALFVAGVVLLALARYVSIGRLLIATVAFAMTSAFWLEPLVSSVGAAVREASYGGTLSALLQNSSDLTFVNAIRMIGVLPITETYRGEPDYPWAYIYAGQGGWGLFTALPFVPLGLAVLGLWRRRVWRDGALVVVVFGGLALLFAAEGTNGPTGRVFEFVFLHLRVFQAYRDPFSEFGFGAMTVLALFLEYGIHAWLRCLGSTRRDLRLGIWGCVAVVLSVGVFAWPMFNGAVFRSPGRVRPGAYVVLPSSLMRIASDLRREDGADAAVLTFPQQLTPLQSSDWPAGYVGMDPLVSLTERPQISTLLSGVGEAQAAAALYGEFAAAPSRALMVCRGLGIRWLLFRWDNNYRFGGVGSTEGLRRLASMLRAMPGITVAVSTRRDLLLHIGGRGGATAIPSGSVLGKGNATTIPLYAGRAVGLDALKSARPSGATVSFEGASLDVGSRKLVIAPHSQSVRLSIAGASEGSVRLPMFLGARTRFLVLRVSGAGGAAIGVAASRYVHGTFVVGGYLPLVNPPAGGGTTVVLHGETTLVYALGGLSFRPNELNVHLVGTEAGRADMLIERVIGVATLPRFEGTSRIEVRSADAGAYQRVAAYYAPWLKMALKSGPYLAVSVKTRGASVDLAGGMVTNGVYQYGAPFKVVSVVGRSASSVGVMVTAPFGAVAYLEVDSRRPYNTLYVVLQRRSSGEGLVSIGGVQLLKRLPGIASDLGSLSAHVGATVALSQSQPLPLVVLPRVGEATVPKAVRRKPEVAVVLPEDYARGWQLQVRVGSGRWVAARARPTLADGFVEAWVWSPDQMASSRAGSGRSSSSVELRAEFVAQGEVSEAVGVTVAGLALSVLVALFFWRPRGFVRF